MKNTDEQIPIRERWTAQLPGSGDEAVAGALLRSAAQASPLDERKLAEIRARLRSSERSRGKSVPRPARRFLRPVIVAAGLILFGGALSAAVSRVIRRIPDRPSEAQTAEPGPTKNPVRHARAKAAKLGDPAAPEAAAETSTSVSPGVPPETPKREQAAKPGDPPAPGAATGMPTPVSPGVPPETPKREQAADQPAPPPAVRLSRPGRSLALRETPNLQPSERGPSPLAPQHVVQPLPAPSRLSRESQPLPAQSELARESRLVASAIAKLRQEGDAEAALVILDQHRAEFASGALRSEATATRIEALLRLGRNPQALALLDAQSLSAKGVGREMLVARAELRADKGRRSAALHDFDLLLSVWGKTDAVAERAVYGRAVCRAKSGDWDGARHDFERYLGDFPQGRFAEQARAALAREHR